LKYTCTCVDLNKYDPERFQPPGLDFRGKLIGIEDVPDARGDKMCQVISVTNRIIIIIIIRHVHIMTCDVYVLAYNG